MSYWRYYLALAALLLLALALHLGRLPFAPVAVTYGLSGLGVLIYGWDKRQARRGGWRVAEKWLWLLALLGGWPGALFAQQWWRHKWRKTAFIWPFYGAALFHCAVLLWIW